MDFLIREGTENNGFARGRAHQEGIDRAVLLDKAEVAAVPVGFFLGEAVDLYTGFAFAEDMPGAGAVNGFTVDGEPLGQFVQDEGSVVVDGAVRPLEDVHRSWR